MINLWWQVYFSVIC